MNELEQAEAEIDGSVQSGEMPVIHPLPGVVLFGRVLESEITQDQNAAPEHDRGVIS